MQQCVERCDGSRGNLGSDDLRDQQLCWRLGGIREVHFSLSPFVVTGEHPQTNAHTHTLPNAIQLIQLRRLFSTPLPGTRTLKLSSVSSPSVTRLRLHASFLVHLSAVSSKGYHAMLQGMLSEQQQRREPSDLRNLVSHHLVLYDVGTFLPGIDLTCQQPECQASRWLRPAIPNEHALPTSSTRTSA